MTSTALPLAPSTTGTAVGTAVGTAFTRTDGPLKVSGGAKYASDRRFPRLLYAVPVCATIARGRITRLDTGAAAAMPGVRAVLTRDNIGRLYRTNDASNLRLDEKRPPLSDDNILYYGQYIALAVADSFEHAQAAAAAVQVKYQQRPPQVDATRSPGDAAQVDSTRGDAGAAFTQAAAGGTATLVDETYTTPTETHNPLELHASVATWDGTGFTLYETSQAIVNLRAVLAQMLGVDAENVRVITEYLGAGFGGKGSPWTHSLLAAAAARKLGHPVKLVLSRKMMFQNVGHRADTRQRMRLSATSDGRLTSLQHDYAWQTSRLDTRKENCGVATPYLYSTPNLRVTSMLTRGDVGPNTSMRGPGAVPGLFALESAMDELAVKLKLDPLALRLRNEPQRDESRNVPFSSRHLKECLTVGAEKFGWARRNPQPGSMRRDGLILGWGMAAATWEAARRPASASVQLRADGSARVASATQDIGTGTYTVLAQMVAQLTGIEMAKIEVVLGDTRLPPGPASGGSTATASLVPAVAQATRAAMDQVLQSVAQAQPSPFPGTAPAALEFGTARIYRKGAHPGTGVPFEKLLQAAQLGYVSGAGHAGPSSADADAKQISIHSYGAHFVEVTWQPELARLRVSRVVAVMDAGRIINPRTGRNQIEGAIIMGIGMALLEQTEYDPRNGAPINSNLADYMMTTHADAPVIDVTFLDYPDKALNEFGARGIGEIGLAGFAPAVSAATYHATGVRVRDLPIRIEDLLSSRVQA
jgi:xanthine dehydrogenase YagR molybdenum-binding subunit